MTAISIYAVGGPFGALLAAIGGGWLAQWIGWRPTFMICGGIGLVDAIIFRLTMREPPRAPTEIPTVRLFATMRTMLSRSEEPTSDLQSLMRISYAVFCLNKKTVNDEITGTTLIYETKKLTTL